MEANKKHPSCYSRLIPIRFLAQGKLTIDTNSFPDFEKLEFITLP
ncbi:MAG: hypothetical protein PHV51_01880 [Methanosarcinaceae archaeon]|nr:hypothetical protein [Methanosarcinaceae archaeon]MDD4496893.1 hypothetical protein [Methanosarcinaceae archaeon]